MASFAARASENTTVQRREVSTRLKIIYFIKNILI